MDEEETQSVSASGNDNDQFTDVREVVYVEESNELKNLIDSITETGGESALTNYARLKQILDRYQEQSQLLDPLMEGMISPLIVLIRAWSREALSLPPGAPPTSLPLLRRLVLVSRLLNTIVTTRGHKATARFFGHEAADVEPVTHLLLRVEAADAAGLGGNDKVVPPAVAEAGGGLWEVKRALLLWMSILVLIPFDLRTVDSTETGEGEAAAMPETSTVVLVPGPAMDSPPGVPPLVRSILRLCAGYLSDPGGIREMAAVLLGRLLTRPDMAAALREFVRWGCAALEDAARPGSTGSSFGGSYGPRAPFIVCGVAQALCSVFKVGQRGALLPAVDAVWPLALSHAAGAASNALLVNNALARKLFVKLAQRVGLCLMEPRAAAWRYDRGKVDLGANLGAAGGAAAQEAPAAAAAEEAEFDLPEETAERVEELVELLLSGLRDRDTVVRWSAAKGLGRVVNRLPRTLGDQVVASAIELLSPAEPDTAWHGACLALAELARRGLLLPERLGHVAPLVARALQYDIRRGAHSVGSHVRDAAAYVCWAFARAYAPGAVLGAATLLAPALLTAACFDREVNCRRAAAAAYQECVGRLGADAVPHGIEILSSADYFSLSVRAHAYLSVAPSVAKYPEYGPAMLDHLLKVKLRHWDEGLRALASQALAALVGPLAPGAGTPAGEDSPLATSALDYLLPLAVDPVLEVRHGATLALAEITWALRAAGHIITSDREAALGRVVPDIEKNRLYRGKGGESMRAAVGRFIECASLARLASLDMATRRLMLATLDDNLKHPTESIQAAAVKAVGAFTAAFMNEEKENFAQRTTLRYLGLLRDPNPAARRGNTRALGALPRALLRPDARAVLEGLCGATRPEDNPDDQDAESRVFAVHSLADVCQTLYGGGGGATAEDKSSGLALLSELVLPALLGAMEDYATDKRGDVGSWVREASMSSLRRVLCLGADLIAGAATEDIFAPSPAAAALEPLATAAVGHMLRQSVERIGRVREASAESLAGLLSHTPPVPGVAHRADLEAFVLRPGRPEPLGTQLSTLEALDEAVALVASAPTYRPAMLEGLVASAGGLDNQHGGKASASLAALQATHGPALSREICCTILDLWAKRPRCPRLATPILKTLDSLFTRGGLAAVSGDGAVLARLMELTRGEVRQCRDVPRLFACAALLAHVAGAEDVASSRRALQSLLTLLVNRYPKVRRLTAEQLYVRLVALDGPAAAAVPDLDAALDAITAVSWDQGEAGDVRGARDGLYGLLGVEPPATTGGAGDGEGGEGQARAPKPKSDGIGYQSLLNDAARGLM